MGRGDRLVQLLECNVCCDDCHVVARCQQYAHWICNIHTKQSSPHSLCHSQVYTTCHKHKQFSSITFYRVLIWCLTLAGIIVICLYGVEESKLLIAELDEVKSCNFTEL